MEKVCRKAAGSGSTQVAVLPWRPPVYECWRKHPLYINGVTHDSLKNPAQRPNNEVFFVTTTKKVTMGHALDSCTSHLSVAAATLNV